MNMRLLVQRSLILLRNLTSSQNVGLYCHKNIISLSQRKLSLSASVYGDRLFSDKHEWVTVDSNIGTVGISDYAQKALGDIVYAQLPDVDSEYEKEGECGALESVKSASDIYSPVSGKVTAKNDEVENDPSLINQSPYDKGWLFKIELTDPSELDSLMNESAYSKLTSELEKEDD